MAGGSRKRTASEEENPPAPVEEETEEVVMEEEEEDPVKLEVGKLRARWELASVLNFMIVFEPLIGKAVKLSAEEIEMGLINPDRSIAQLHIALLKGIPPVSRVLDGPDEWITVLCKKLAPWWRWVAEGEIPLVAAKGEEKSRYKELDPTKRLLLLKALCELRAEQDDAFAYINDALKEGTDVSFFRKDKIGGDGNGTSYWYEGNPVIGNRLYKEVTILESKAKSRGKGILDLQTISFQWETVATNLEEFQKVVDELSSSKEEGNLAVANALQTSTIPVLEKLQKKKEKALKDKERRERLLNDWRNSYSVGTTRSCRNRRPVNYTFDEYDRAIHEAIKVTNKKKTTVEKGQESKRRRRNEIDTTVASEGTTNSEDNSGKKSDPDNSGGKKDDSSGNDTASEMVREDSHDEDDDNWGGTKDGESSEHSDQGNSETDKNHERTDVIAPKPLGSRWSKRLAGDTDHPSTNNRNLRTKNMSRQRPICNSALDSAVVPDSEDENSFEHEESPATDPKEVTES